MVQLEDLPEARPGRNGWPWTEAPASLPPVMPNGRPWPRISIITPSYNQGDYLEETIRSVLLQGYPNLEYHVLDGGSTDDSAKIIAKYKKWLTGWVSERDRGQSDAINKGFLRTTGEIFNWLCSDDLLMPGALGTVAEALTSDGGADVLAGKCFCQFDDDAGRSRIEECDSRRFEAMPYMAAIWQPSCFFRRSLIGRSELVRMDLHYCMDRELWCYLRQRRARWKWTPETLSVYRFTGNNKSVVGREKILNELEAIYALYEREPLPLTFWLRRVWLPLVRARRRHRNRVMQTASGVLSRAVSLCLRCSYPRERIRALQGEYQMYGMPGKGEGAAGGT